MSERKRRRSDQPAPRYQESSGSGSGDSDVEFVHDSDESPFKDEEEAEEEEEWGTPSRSKRKSVESKQKKEPVKKQSQKKASTKAKASSVKKEIKDVKKQEASAKKAREKKPVSPKKKESRVSLMLDSSDSENDDWQMGSKTPKQSSIMSSSSEEEERKKTGRKTKVDTLDEGGEGERKTVLEGTDALSPEDLIQVQVMREQEVAVCIEEVMVKCLESILRGKGFEYLIPSRAASNQVYLADQDRIGLKKSKMTSRAFVNAREVQKATYTTRILELIHNILMKGIHITKRDLFYTDVKLFQKQENSDTILDDVACMLGCTRTSLNVVASEKGLVVGRLQFEEDGDEINCSRMGVGGKGIPPMIDRVTNLRSDAEFILLVEKDAAFMRLSEDRFYNKMKCIIVTAKGQPDVATRMFLKRLRHELQLPVLALVDSDPYGLKILSVYMSGSKNMSYDSASLTCPDIKWLGVRPSDLDRYKIPPECRLKMTEADKKTGEAMLKEDFIKKNPAWVKELQLMLRTGEKAEIQALSNFGFQYLTETYLPEKISQKDFI